MSAIGRIFIILNLILAAAFLAWASTALNEASTYRGQFLAEETAHTQTRTTLEEEKSQLATQLRAEQTAKDTMRSERDQLKAEADRLKAELDTEQRANAQLLADVAAIKETLGGYNETIRQLEAAKDAAVAEARDSERQLAEATQAQTASTMAQRDAEEALAGAQASIADLEKRLKSTRDSVSQLETQLSTFRDVTGVSLSEIGSVQPLVQGKVLAVDYSLKPGLVQLNVGSEDKVTRGMTFEIYSGDTYKGQVRVQDVRPTMSSALVTRAQPDAQIRQGDNATTRL